MKIKIHLSILPIILTSFILSCATAPTVPSWVERYPQDNRYYIGIGSSSSSVLANAQDEAREEALANLAASISTSIVSEVELETGETTEGVEFKSLKRRIEEKVYQKLEGAEVVDSFSSPSAGYWIYLRYDKANLLRQKKELADRVEELTAPVFKTDAAANGESLTILHKAHTLLVESPYFASLKGKPGENEGVLIDLVEARMQDMLGTLSVSVSPLSIEGSAGEKVDLSINLSGESAPSGLPVALIESGRKIAGGNTDTSGSYTSSLELSTLPIGRGTLSAVIDLQALDISGEDYFISFIQSGKEVMFVVNPLPLKLIIQQEYDYGVPGVREMASSLFAAEDLPFSLVEESAKAEYAVRMKLIVEDFPKYKENSLEISQARIVIQLEKAGEVIYSWESSAMKDGGLTLTQSHERTIKKLFEKIRSEKKYLNGLIEALPVRAGY